MSSITAQAGSLLAPPSDPHGIFVAEAAEKSRALAEKTERQVLELWTQADWEKRQWDANRPKREATHHKALAGQLKSTQAATSTLAALKQQLADLLAERDSLQQLLQQKRETP